MFRFGVSAVRRSKNGRACPAARSKNVVSSSGAEKKRKRRPFIPPDRISRIVCRRLCSSFSATVVDIQYFSDPTQGHKKKKKKKKKKKQAFQTFSLISFLFLLFLFLFFFGTAKSETSFALDENDSLVLRAVSEPMDSFGAGLSCLFFSFFLSLLSLLLLGDAELFSRRPFIHSDGITTAIVIESSLVVSFHDNSHEKELFLRSPNLDFRPDLPSGIVFFLCLVIVGCCCCFFFGGSMISQSERSFLFFFFWRRSIGFGSWMSTSRGDDIQYART